MTKFLLSDRDQYYRNRRGEMVGPVKWSIVFHAYTCNNVFWDERGRRSMVYELPEDLVAVWGDEGTSNVISDIEDEIMMEDEIVIKDNVLEYVSVVKTDNYGIVHIESTGDNEYYVRVDAGDVSPAELREAAKVFEELAAFIESQD